MSDWLRTLFFGFLICFGLVACTGGDATPPALPTLLAVATIAPTTPATAQATLSLPTSLPPTLRPTRPPQPTATDSPTLADWTILVYMTADNSLEAAALRDLNEMESAADNKTVQVVVQIDRANGRATTDPDWTEARRYLLRGDNDPSQISMEPVASLGEVNMGDPATFFDFLTWGIRTYPANHYALIIWDHGAGWNGIGFDSDVGFPDQTDSLSLNDLDSALSQVLAQNNLDQFDVIAFDACLMAQLEVFQAIEPYAGYGVASEELTPGAGWDYTSWLQRVYAQPNMDGKALAQTMVQDFADHYRQTDPQDFVTLSAVDLRQVPALTTAVEQLATALNSNPTFIAGAVGDARSGAESYARVSPEQFEQYAAIDLADFARILAQRAPDTAVQAAANAVSQAVSHAVVVNETGLGLKKSHGIAIYFPRTQEFYTPEYGRISQMPAWNIFLTSYHTVGLADLLPPSVTIPNVLRDTVGVQNPAYLDFEIVGRNIRQVLLLGGAYEADGRRRLLEYDTLLPEPTILPDGTELHSWRDGVHDDFYVWSTKITYLSDSQGTGDFVIMWPAGGGSPTTAGSSLFTVQGMYRPNGSDTLIAANLVFDHKTQSLAHVWLLPEGTANAPTEITPQADDEFTPAVYYLNDKDEIETEAGDLTLVFDETAVLTYRWLPLPDGRYFLGFEAQNNANANDTAFTDLTVQNGDAVAGVTAYLDPYLGFQFLYPETWYPPIYKDALLYTTNPSGTTQLQITLYPNAGFNTNETTLQKQTLAIFGAVDVVFEDWVKLGSIRALRTAYGYEDPTSGPHTGVFLTFLDKGTGYVVDIDGRQADEEETVTAVATLLQSWQFLNTGIGLQPGQWGHIDLPAFTVAQPTDFTYQSYNGWQRFVANASTFVALRTQPATLPANDVLAALLRDASQGVTNFAANPPTLFALGMAGWMRADFAYTAADGKEIRGFIMVKIENGQEVVAWAEAPKTGYAEIANNVFLMMVADMELKN